MIRVSVFYPTTEGATFDHDYYREQARPAGGEDVGAPQAPRSTRASTGRTSPPSTSSSTRSKPWQSAMGSPGTADVMADVANYTTITPVLQTSEMIE